MLKLRRSKKLTENTGKPFLSRIFEVWDSPVQEIYVRDLKYLCEGFILLLINCFVSAGNKVFTVLGVYAD